MSCHALEDSGNLLGSLALREDDFGQSGAQCPMVVHLGEPEIFKRQVAQAGNSLISADAAAFHLLEKLA
jgi:hypothetical protein